MLASLTPGSLAETLLLALALALILAFEFSNGFHDTANAVATAIYTHSLPPVAAVVLSGIMNFLGVVLGGIAVAYALIDILPADALSPPNGGAAVALLLSVGVTALSWNVATWAMGIPNSSSHALIGALFGIALAHLLRAHENLATGADWSQIWDVLKALLVSPVLGFAVAAILFKLAALFLHEPSFYQPPEEGSHPPLWLRSLLVLTCSGVSFAHGTSDGQKSIGLIMLAVIAFVPASYGMNRDADPAAFARLAGELDEAAGLLHGFDVPRAAEGAAAATSLGQRLGAAKSLADIPNRDWPAVRADLQHAREGLNRLADADSTSEADKTRATALAKNFSALVNYAPWWVRVISALCLGLGTMVGYKRIVRTLGERIGKTHLEPVQGAAAEVMATGLITSAGLTGLPVSTTHVLSSGIAGTMVARGTGLQWDVVRMIGLAWVLTLPATVAISCGLFLVLT